MTRQPKSWLERKAARWRGLADCPAHFGGTIAVLEHLSNRVPWLRRPCDRVRSAMAQYTDYRTMLFDATHGTDTFRRLELRELEVGATLPTEQFRGWKYGPINQDFFHEIIERCPIDRGRTTFLDVGCGKGAAVLMASEYGFRRVIGLDFSSELLEIAQRNTSIYERKRGRSVSIDWVHADFMTHTPPDEPLLLFLNNPFPADISRLAVDHIHRFLRGHRSPVVLAYRRPEREIKRMLERSDVLRLHRRTPYWMILSNDR